MPPAIDVQIRGQVIKEWLSGYTRDEIAANNGIGGGTASNIINEWRKGIDSTEYESIRDLALFSKREGIILEDLASRVRLINYVKRLGANLEQIEFFIENIVDSQDPQKLIDTANQIAQLSISDSMPLEMMSDHIKRQQDEVQKIKEEIEKAGAILEQKNVDIQTIDEYKKMEKELNTYNLSLGSPRKLVSILNTINQMGYDTQKIVKELARIKSLKQTERQLEKGCETLEKRATQYKEILPLCEQITDMGIGSPELLAFHAAVFKMMDADNLPYGQAPYALMDGIDTSEKLIDAKKQLNEIWKQSQMINFLSARQKDAVNVLVKLQLCGMTDDQILRCCRVIEADGHSLNLQPINSQISFNSDRDLLGKIVSNKSFVPT